MALQTTDLQAERELLAKDFEALSERIKKVDVELIQMKSNLNAVHGAIQQIDKLITMSENDKSMPKETPPNTADAMKRHKAGKAGFTDIAHLKAKGLIPRSDGKKKVSDKYK